MKNTVVIPAIQNKELNKFGGWSWMDYSITAWKYWCKQNDVNIKILSDLNPCDERFDRISSIEEI